ncbi:hypothetical protein P9222_25280 [Paenibacillus amylolyticus]|nr:hypothetical protein [Paenibacillus amylolyticus]WFR61673.1 hypothetical protein P9222_25280 [Paenibacillus amylolyticus]
MELLNHIYWKKKAEFALAEDIYDAWVVFAVEEGVFRYEIDGQSGEAGFADLVLCPPRVPFRRETVTPLTFHYMLFRCHSADAETSCHPSANPSLMIQSVWLLPMPICVWRVRTMMRLQQDGKPI